ncbi:hypothetical protein Tco_1372033, partial [Tanacetum coccineum]
GRGSSKRTIKLNVEASGGDTSSSMGPFFKLVDAYGSRSPNSLAHKIHDIEKQLVEGKLVLCDDDGKPIKPCSHTQDEADLSVGGADKPIFVVEEQMEMTLLKKAAPTTFASLVYRLEFARALIDIIVDRPIKDDMVIAIPFVEGSGSYLHTIKVEYEEETTKMRHVRNATTRNDVFQVVQNRKSKDKQHIRSMGFKPKTTFENVGTSRTGNVNNNVQDESKAVLYEDDDYDIYDNYDIQGLSKSNWCFVTRWVFVFEVLEDARLYLASL